MTLIRFRRPFADRAGNVALIFAVLAPVLVLAAGGAIDVTNASMRQAQLQAAVDAAAVGAVSRGSPAYLAALQMSSTGTSTVTAPNEVANAQAIFDANRRNANDTSVTPITVAVTKTGTVVSSVVSDTGTFTPSFLGLIGQHTIQLAATSHASDNIPAYMNFYMLLDNTPSMGLAATTAGIQTMVSNTSDQCAFACHDTSVPAGTDYYSKAKSLGVQTRIYNVAQAAANLFQTAQSTETANGIPQEFSVAVYDFGADASVAGLTQISPQQVGATTSNLQQAASDAAKIDVMTVNGQGYNSDEDTDLDTPLAYAAANLPVSGNGSSASSPQQVLFIVSDGIIDAHNCSYNDGGSCRQISPLDNASCALIKAKGIQIAVLYTTYLPLPTNSFWQSWVQPFTTSAPTQIYSGMQACASSPKFFKEVNSDQDINAAMQQLFQNVVASVKITG